MSKLNFSFGCAFLILLLNSCNVGGSDVNPDMVLAACDGIASGGIQSRTQYQASQVAFGQTCSSEVQSRTCTNGKWSNWSGTFAYNACIIGDPAACIDTGIVSSPPISSSTNTALLASSGGTTSSGATETRTAYQYSSVPYGQTCAQETETRTCSNGTWSSWTPGDYTYTSCAVLPPAPCGTVASGGTQTQKMYQYAQEAFGFNCVSETQTRTCTNGTWSNWSGTFTQPTCKDFHTAAPTVFSIGSETPDSKIYEIHWHPGLNSLFVAMQDEDPTTFSLSSEIRRCPNNASCLPVGSSRPTYPLIPQFVDYSATVFFQDRPVAATQFTGPVIPGTADIGSAGSVSTVYPVMYSIVSDSALPGATMGLAEVGLQSAAGHFIYWMTAGTVNTTYSLNP